ncbi:uncharacterized protein LOC111862998 isoform X4 [Cryptotermes secundus]|uniref:uncharacterized protein LOC111862998 isoform X4 n=1 Tax=Cryptotermes secundus TaxID=105785 RepID=UPI000CD7B653|nr:uncharacterized protein LOC111862998 isoform X4 [Cryptotermes secundus]
MCDDEVSGSKKTLQSEEIFPAVKQIMKDEPGSHSEACPSLSHDGDQAVNIKVEEFSDIEDGEDPVPMTVVGIKAEYEEDAPASHSETCASPSLSGDQAFNIKVEEFSDIEDREDPVPMPVEGIKAEYEDSLDSQEDEPASHSEACASSSLDGVQAVYIKVEEFSDIEDSKDSEPMAVVGIKAEHEDCAHPQEDVPGSCTDTCPTTSHDAFQAISIKVQEASDVEEEGNPVAISFPVMKAEHAEPVSGPYP